MRPPRVIDTTPTSLARMSLPTSANSLAESLIWQRISAVFPLRNSIAGSNTVIHRLGVLRWPICVQTLGSKILSTFAIGA